MSEAVLPRVGAEAVWAQRRHGGGQVAPSSGGSAVRPDSVAWRRWHREGDVGAAWCSRCSRG